MDCQMELMIPIRLLSQIVTVRQIPRKIHTWAAPSEAPKELQLRTLHLNRAPRLTVYHEERTLLPGMKLRRAVTHSPIRCNNQLIRRRPDD
jgi:hypothetical protein